MKSGSKNFHQSFAIVSLGFILLLGLAATPGPVFAGGTSSNNSSVKRDAASSQFGRAEELREALNTKPTEKRTLAEYKQVVNSYRRVYLITPHAVQVPEALVALGELNTEMGDRFGQSYYQAAVESYQFLIREYPTSKFVPEVLLRVAKLHKDQLGDPGEATKEFQDYQKKYPHSPRKREVSEELAELALLKSAETGQLSAKNAIATPSATPPAEKVPAPMHAPAAAANAPSTRTLAPTKEELGDSFRASGKSGGETAKSGGVPRVQQIRTNATPASTEVTIDLEDSVQYVSGRIASPDRIYFDLHAAKLSPNVAHGNVAVSGPLLSKVRVAQNQFGVVRVVLDVNGVQDYAASIVKKPTRLLIELYGDASRAKPEPVQSAKVVETPKPQAVQKEPIVTRVAEPQPVVLEDPSREMAAVKTSDIPIVTPPAAASGKNSLPSSKPTRTNSTKTSTSKADLIQPSTPPTLTRDGQSTLTRALGLKIGRIVIDAGHGGHDTGTIGPTGLMEKDLCLDVALRLGKLIQQKLPDTEIVYTRSDDTFIPLEERTHIANDIKADLFLSIHANSSPDRGARGVETYYLNLRGSPEAMEVAARENAVGQENIHDLEDMVKKITRTEKIDESKELAEDIQDSLSKRVQKTAKPVKNRGVRKAPFVVLIGADMPSILTEISFLSNPSDEQLLKKPEHRQHIAEGVFAGVTSYLQSLNSLSATGKPRPAPVSPVEQSRNQN
ncbi:MAG TPA: N-acetylmuramoyl-L-alanine amidase [Candidatus Acidoferrum sp.]|nr:N-acetylmuramoyl-L-alanine amidase [Candidatus Acidoferrum sp.]